MKITDKDNKHLINTNSIDNKENKIQNKIEQVFNKIDFRELNIHEKELTEKLELKELQDENELLKNSILQRVNEDKNFSLPELEGDSNSVDRLYSHVMGDTLISETSMEGYNLEKTSSFMADFLRFLQKEKVSEISSISDSLLESFSNLTDDYEELVIWQQSITQVKSTDKSKRLESLKQLADTIAKEISGLSLSEGKKKHIVLPGGWSGKPAGHAMLYDFSINKEGTYDIAIYNTGGGVRTHHDRMLCRNKELIRPIVRYENVPKENLFFPDKDSKIRSLFFQKLLECNIIPLWNTQLEIKPEDIYVKAFTHLDSYRAVVDANIVDFATEYQTGQRSGICSFKVLLPYLYYHLDFPNSENPSMDRLKAFKWFRHQLGFYSTLSYYRNKKEILSEDAPEASRARYLLKYGAKKILIHVARLNQLEENESILSKQEIKTAHATAKQLLEQIEEIEKKIFESQQDNIKEIDLKEIKEIDRDLKNDLISLQRGVVESKEKLVSISTNGWFKTAARPDPENILERLKEEKTVLETSTEKQYQIERLIDSLPIDKNDDYWERVPKEHLSDCLEMISFFMEEYANQVLNPTPANPEQSNTLFAAYAITATLARRVDELRSKEYKEPSLSDYGVHFALDHLEEDLFTTFYSPSAYDRRLEIIRYFESEKEEQLFDFGAITRIDDKSIEKSAECLYYQNLLDSNKVLKEKITNSSHWSIDQKSRNKAKLKLKTFEVAELAADIQPDEINIKTGGFLSGSGLKHIALLKRAAYLSQLGIGLSSKIHSNYINLESYSHYRPEENQIASSFNYRTFELAKVDRGSWVAEESKWAKGCDKRLLPNVKMHRKMDSSLLNFFSQFKGNRRSFLENETIPEEGKSLIEEFFPVSSFTSPFNHSARDTSESELQPYEVLHHFRQYEKEKLERPHMQTAFEILFFKSLSFKEEKTYRTMHPLFQEFKKETPLIEQSAQFINEGIDYFYDAQPGHRPNVQAALFFLRLSMRLRHLISKTSKSSEKLAKEFPAEKSLLLEWLSREDLKDEERSAIHTHLLLHSALLMQTEVMKPEDKLQALKSWLFIKRHQIKEEWRDPYTIEFVEKWIHKEMPDLKTKLDVDEAFRLQFFQFGLREYWDGKSYENGEWECDYPCYKLIIEEFGKKRWWQINLQTGDICSDEGNIWRTAPLPSYYLNDLHYKHLFGTALFDANSRGDHYYFFSPLYGEVRMKSGSPTIQRRVKGEWLQYISPSKAQGILNNYALSADHTHWICNLNSESCPMEILDYQTGKLRAIVTKEGKVELIDKKTLFELNDTALRKKLEDFEDLRYLLFTKNEENQFQFSFPRYKTIDGNGIGFKENSSKDCFVSIDNENIKLSSKAKLNWIGGFKNYLTLTDLKDRPKKVLIPCRQFYAPASLQELSSHCKINLGKQETKSEKKEDKVKEIQELFEKQQGAYTCLEFDLKNGEPCAQNSEGWLFLSYIALAQKDYIKAVDYLNKLSQTDQISPLGMMIFTWIIQSEKTLIDGSHDAKAVRLNAAALLLKAMERPEFTEDKEKANELIVELLKKQYREYLSLIDNIDKKILLSKKTEELFFLKYKRLLDDDQIINRKKFLETGLYPKFIESIVKKSGGAMEIPVRDLGYLSIDYSNDYSSNESYKKYLRDYENYTQFLTIEPEENIFLLLSADWKHIKNSFRMLYDLARSGTKSDENYIEFLLSNIQPEKKDQEFDRYLAYIEVALKDPNAPKLPSTIAGTEEKAKWLKNVRNRYQNLAQNNQKKVSTYPIESKNQEFLFPLNLTKGTNNLSNEEQKWEEIPSLNLDKDPNFTVQPFLEKYLTISTDEEKESLSFEDLGLKLKLEGKDAIYQGALDAALDLRKKDYEEGVKINKAKKKYAFIDENGCSNLKGELENYIKSLQTDFLKGFETNILRLANRLDSDNDKRQRELLLLSGGPEKKIELEQLVLAFLKGKRSGFRDLNPRLTIEEVDQLFQWIGEYLQASTELQQAERTLGWIGKLEKLEEKEKKKKNPNYQFEKERILRELGTELYAKCAYDPNKGIDYLVYEYHSKKRIRPKQIEIIEKMCAENNSRAYSNLVVQLIMGGGKSKLIGPLVGYKATCRPDRLSLFIVPQALFSTVKEDLKESQKENFGQEINAIELDRKQMNYENLQWTKAQLEKAIKNQEMVVVKGELLQSLCLEYIYLYQSYDKMSSELFKKISVLQDILTLLKTKTDAIGDEVDQLLNVLKAVNFPIGEEESLSSERVDLVKEIYVAMTSKDLLEKVGLHENRQNLLTEKEYHEEIKPKIAEHLFSLKQLSCFDSRKEAFISYLTDSIIAGEEKEEEKFFLFLLNNYSMAKEEDLKEAANLIALGRYILNQILPITLSKNYNRHYGRTKTGNQDLVIPYHGVGTPSKSSLFGNPWEAACLQFQTVICSGVNSSQIRALAGAMKQSADHFAQKFGEKFEETAEAIEFQKLTNVPLSELEKQIDKAVVNVNHELHKKLQVEAGSITHTVKFHTRKLNSSSQMLPNLVDKKRMFTGTPWNSEMYDSSLSKNVDLEVGTEGQIADILLERAEKRKTIEGRDKSIHFVSSNDSKEVLNQVLNNCERKERVRAIIDTGALFKGSNNLETAKGILSHYKGTGEVKAVVFYYCAPGQTSPDSLAMLKEGSDEPILIKNTSASEIASKGIPLDQIFFYYDERHTTGVDFVQLPNAINLMTCDPGMLERTFFQGAMRARQLLFGQDLEYVIHKAAQDSFVNKAARVKDILLTCIKNQAIRKSKDLYKSYLQKIDYALKDFALKQLTGKRSWSPEVFKKHEKILIDSIEDNPYKQFGLINSEISPIVALKNYAEACKLKIPGEIALADALDQIIEEAKENEKLLPQKIANSSGLAPEAEQEVELQVEVNIEKEVEVNVDLEVQKELESYRKYGLEYYYQEKPWSDEAAEKLLKGSHESSDNPIEKLADIVDFSKSFDRGVIYRKDYKHIFDSNIFVTKNFAHTINKALPVFHNLQKNGEQILFVKTDDEVKAYFLSLKEVLFFKNFLEKNYNKGNLYANVWLALPDGELFVRNPHGTLPRGNDAIERVLVQVNFFNGNVLHLNKESDQFENWLEEKAYDEKVHFIKRRVKPNQRDALYRSGLLDLGVKGKGKSRYTLFASRKEKLLNPSEWISKLSEKKIKAISASLVPYLPKEKIPYLSRPLQIAKLKAEQIGYVDPTQVPLLSEGQLQYLQTKAQVNAVASEFYQSLASEQFGLLSDEKLQAITGPALIQKVPNGDVERLVSGQVKHLKATQVAYIIKDQAKFLETEDQINAMPEDFYGVLTPEKWGLLKTEKLQKITDPELIKKIPNDQVERINQSQVKHLDESQVLYLKTKEQINALDSKWYKNLAPQELGLLDDDKLQKIEDPTLIKKVPNTEVKRIHENQVKHLDESQVPYLKTKEQINALDSKWYKNLAPQELGLLDDDKLQKIEDPALIKKVPNTEVKRIHENQVKHIDESQVPHLKTKEQINALESKWYKNLASQELGLLTDDKLEKIEEAEVIKVVSVEHVEKLAIAQLNKIVTKQVPGLKTPDKIKVLKNKDLIGALNEEQVKLASTDQVELMTEEQLGWLMNSREAGEELIKKAKEVDQKRKLKPPVNINVNGGGRNTTNTTTENTNTENGTTTDNNTDTNNNPSPESDSNPANLDTGYNTLYYARKINCWLNRKSDYYQVHYRAGWKKIYYVGNFVAPAKAAHMVGVVVNVVTAVAEFFLAIVLLPAFFGKGAAGLLLIIPAMRGGRVSRIWHNWDWSALGHLGNSMAYSVAAVVDFVSALPLFTTPKLFNTDLNNKIKRKLRIIA
jgi:hypothetical protein